ncbi:MAG TPA: lipase family protein [Pseudonocardiaceae bacterium]|jgi:alpha-beta hydrolase superfamily lysophospholipase/uncharacterized membrane protein HdeD (DUF308 family)|nr:lipase family protein [Pseudonocardiaceae bacterium]
MPTSTRLPRWADLLLGLGCLGLGGWLISAPLHSLPALAALVAAGAVLTGLVDLGSVTSSARPWLPAVTGVGWLVVGLVALFWPGLSILGLAIAVGVGLVLGGIGELVSPTGADRLVGRLGGAASGLLGVLALAWPAATLLVVAVVFGLRLVLFGIGLLTDVRPAHMPGWVRLGGTIAVLVLAVGGTVASVAVHRAAPAAPGTFYTAPEPLPAGPPGTIIRDEVVPGFLAGATTYRVLYKSTGLDGHPTAVSGLILVPAGAPPAGGRKVLAYTHGTVGVASNCAPSLAPPAAQPLLAEGGAGFVGAGYVVAATDYQGLGTAGPHPFLVGPVEAENELDIVRAARLLPAARAGTEFAVWGHSQGGHAALFTGQLAASYAPELDLVGVAAGAPVPNLVDLFAVNLTTTVGKVLIAMALSSWARVYHDANLDQIVTPAARPLVDRIAATCLYGQQQLAAAVPNVLALRLSFLSAPPWQVEPWRSIAAANNPGQAPIDAPVLLVQGGADTIVDPATTQRLATAMCAEGETVDLRLLPGVGHLQTGQLAAPDVARWIADRFAGRAAASTCVG